MKVEYELTDYICMYIDRNGYIDCVLCNDYNTALKIYEKYENATIINIDCTRNFRSIINQKSNINIE